MNNQIGSIDPSEMCSILLVDDNPDYFEMLAATLSRLGQQLVLTLSGAEAIEQAKHQEFAVILLDVQMPEMSGFETAQQLRATPLNQHTPLIMVTGFDPHGLRASESYSVMGVVDYLVKPFNPDMLRAKVQVFVELFRQRARNQRQAEQLRKFNHELEYEIAERKSIEASLLSSESRLRALVTHVPIGLYQADANGNYLFVNERWTALTGLSLPEALGPLWVNPIHPDDRTRVIAEWQARVSAGQEFDMDYRLAPHHGEAHWISAHATAVHDARGIVTGYFGIIRDITVHKQTEAELHQLNATLEQRVTMRTQDLTRSNEMLMHEVSARVEAEANLKTRLLELDQLNQEITLQGRLVSLLQSCQGYEEAYTVIAQFMPQLFPYEDGLIAIGEKTSQVFDPVVYWGPSKPVQKPLAFELDDCWALRRERTHLQDDTDEGVLCKHLLTAHPRSYICVPLASLGEVSGVVHVCQPASSSAQLNERRRVLVETVTEHIALALGNLKLREKLQYQSVRDPLTGLYNRRYMEESLERELHRAIRNQKPLCVIMLDIDHFKDFNDQFGHEAGDQLLQELGNYLQSHLRSDDIACRYGGEEFTLILPSASLENTLARAEQWRSDIRHLSLNHRRPWSAALTTSLGIAAFPAHGQTGKDLLRIADAALYRAKASGRDRIVVGM